MLLAVLCALVVSAPSLPFYDKEVFSSSAFFFVKIQITKHGKAIDIKNITTIWDHFKSEFIFFLLPIPSFYLLTQKRSQQPFLRACFVDTHTQWAETGRRGHFYECGHRDHWCYFIQIDLRYFPFLFSPRWIEDGKEVFFFNFLITSEGKARLLLKEGLVRGFNRRHCDMEFAGHVVFLSGTWNDS